MENPRFSKLAIASAVMGVLFFLPFISGLSALILGIIALRVTALYQETLKGAGLAVFGIIMGIFHLLFLVAVAGIIVVVSLAHRERLPRNHLMIAEHYADLDQDERAIEYYERALSHLVHENKYAVGATEFFLYNALGVAYTGTGQSDRALSAYESALGVARKSMGLAYYGLATAYTDSKEFEKTLQAAQKAIEYNPALFVAYQEKAAALRNLDRFQDSVDACKETISRFPEFAQSYSSLGLAYEKLGNFQEALEAHIEAIRLNPRRFYPRDRLYFLFYRLSDPIVGRTLLEKLRLVDAHLAQTIEEQARDNVIPQENSFDTLNRDPRDRLEQAVKKGMINEFNN